MSTPEPTKKFITLDDVLRWIATEGVKLPPGARRGGVDVETPYEVAQASAREALVNARAYLEHGDGAVISAANGITARKP